MLGWARCSFHGDKVLTVHVIIGVGKEGNRRKKWDAEVFRVMFEAIFWATVSKAKCLLRQKRKSCSNLILMNKRD